MKRQIYTTIIVLCLLILPMFFVYGNTNGNGTYEPLTNRGIPLYNDTQKVTIEGALQVFFAISVAVSAVLAVIMLSIGGFRYMTSASAFSMGDAKNQITNAIVGLLIVLVAVVALKYINPDIIKFNIFNP